MIRMIAESSRWVLDTTLDNHTLSLWFTQSPKKGSVVFAFINTRVNSSLANVSIVPQSGGWVEISTLGIDSDIARTRLYYKVITNNNEIRADFTAWLGSVASPRQVVITGHIVETDADPTNPIESIGPLTSSTGAMTVNTSPAGSADNKIRDTLAFFVTHRTVNTVAGISINHEGQGLLKILGDFSGVYGPHGATPSATPKLGSAVGAAFAVPSVLTANKIISSEVGTWPTSALQIRINRKETPITGSTRARIIAPHSAHDFQTISADVPEITANVQFEGRVRTGMIMIAQVFGFSNSNTSEVMNIDVPPGWILIAASPPEWASPSRQVRIAYKVNTGERQSGIFRAWDSATRTNRAIDVNIVFVEGNVENPIQGISSVIGQQPPAMVPEHRGAASLIISQQHTSNTDVTAAPPWERVYFRTPQSPHTITRRYAFTLTHDVSTDSPVVPVYSGGNVSTTLHFHIMLNPPPAPEFTIQIGPPTQLNASPILEHGNDFISWGEDLSGTGGTAAAFAGWPPAIAAIPDAVGIAQVTASGTSTISIIPPEDWELVDIYHQTNTRIGAIYVRKNWEKSGSSAVFFAQSTGGDVRLFLNITFWRSDPIDPLHVVGAPGTSPPDVESTVPGAMVLSFAKTALQNAAFSPPPGMTMSYSVSVDDIPIGAGVNPNNAHAMAYRHMVSEGVAEGLYDWSLEPSSSPRLMAIILNPPSQPADAVTHSQKLLEDFTFSRGLDVAQALGSPMAGVASFSLHNLFGGLSPANSEIEIGDEVTIREHGIVVFRGYIEDVDWELDNTEELSTAHVTAISSISRLTEKRITERLWNNHTLRWAMDRILDQLRWPQSMRVIDTSDVILGSWPTREISDAFNELARLTRTEGLAAMMYESADGVLVFRNRFAASSEPRSTTVQAVYGGPGNIAIDGHPSWISPHRNLINRATATAEHRKLDDSLVEVWRHENTVAPLVLSRARHFITAKMPDVLESAATPALLNGDWGYQLGGNAIILIHRVTSQEVTLEIDTTNASTTNTTFSFIRLMGLLRRTVGETLYQTEDWIAEPLIERYGVHTLSLDIDPSLPRPNDFLARCNEIVLRYGNGRAIIEWTTAGHADLAHMDREIGDRVEVHAAGFAAVVTIYKMRSVVSKGEWHSITYTGEVEHIVL